jgi:signal transduction histidine kinase
VKSSARYAALVIALSAASIGVFYFLNLHNRRAVEASTLEMAVSEGQTIEKVLAKAATQLLAGGEAPLVRFMDELFANEQVVFVALKRSGRLLHAASKYEGYLPLGSEIQAVTTFASPLGEIIEVAAVLDAPSGARYTAHIGYHFSVIGEIRQAARKNLLLLTLLQSAIVLVLVSFLYSFNRQLRRKEGEIQKEKEEKERIQEISLITAGINHEIRNPLNSLYLSFQMLEPLLDPDDSEAAFHSRSLKKEIQRIQGIVERFSSLTHEIRIRRETIDWAEIIEALRTNWQNAPCRLDTAVDLGTRPSLLSDRGLIAQVLDNIVRNAVEAGATRVAIRVEAHKGKSRISIRDDGQGIRQEHLKFIFDPFVSFKSRGSGIGLALSRRIIGQLGGKIDVRSLEGQGAEFVILL